MKKSTQLNHLAGETSPYLKQHESNPVHWYPWGEKALEIARKHDKPILLSIGYTACHWCHVMAHESFEDAETADLMNQLFINIKIDREERPDLDKIYQTAHALLTQRSGGWPLTVFLTPNDLIPFFSGTYFPHEARYNLPSFKYVLRSISDLYRKHRNEITAQNKELLEVLTYSHHPNLKKIKLSLEPLELAKQTLKLSYDAKNGGFGTAPKFPQPAILNFLLNLTARKPYQNEDLNDETSIIISTLQHMAEGGIYDQLAGGFFRYSVDAAWRIPHFEKMLYDNAGLLEIYAKAACYYQNTYFKTIAEQLAEWVLEYLNNHQGGFYCSMDADSDKKEGKYYLWNKYEIQQKLTSEEYAVVNSYYGLEFPPNFENQWHLYITKPLTEIASDLKQTPRDIATLLYSANKKLLTIRKERPLPFVDKKILTAWNALMINALFTAGKELKIPKYISLANQTLNFIYHDLWKENRLMANFTQGKARFSAYLDDYAFLLTAVITALKNEWSEKFAKFAIDLANGLITLFLDERDGGFFFTANDHELLVHRPKSMTDESLPSGNGVAADALITLGYLLGETKYLDAANKTLMGAWEMLSRYPVQHSTLLIALKNYLEPGYIVVIRGPQHDIVKWHEYAQIYPNLSVFAIPNETKNLPGLLSTHSETMHPSAYLCKGTHCEAVIHDFNDFKSKLEGLDDD